MQVRINEILKAKLKSKNDETLQRETDFGRIRIQLELKQDTEDEWEKTIYCTYPFCTYRTNEKPKLLDIYQNTKK